ncbi:hypothetical protein D3C74_183910 [compost metagenome]
MVYYPTIEMIARNINSSSKTVERHITELADKKMILVSQGKNNTYYLPNYLHCHPYVLMSEKTHEFIGSVRKQVYERDLTLWVKGIVKRDETRRISLDFKGFTKDASQWTSMLRRNFSTTMLNS